jgi:hypothetical protein
LREMNNLGLKCPLTLLHGVKALILTLKQWNQDKDVSIKIFNYHILIHITVKPHIYNPVVYGFL